MLNGATTTPRPQADPVLVDFARRLRQGLPAGPERFREALESSLQPLIRRVLHSGAGPAGLVRWVQEHADRLEATRAAGQLARSLADQLLELIDPLHARETVVSLS